MDSNIPYKKKPEQEQELELEQKKEQKQELDEQAKKAKLRREATNAANAAKAAECKKLRDQACVLLQELTELDVHGGEEYSAKLEEFTSKNVLSPQPYAAFIDLVKFRIALYEGVKASEARSAEQAEQDAIKMEEEIAAECTKRFEQEKERLKQEIAALSQSHVSSEKSQNLRICDSADSAVKPEPSVSHCFLTEFAKKEVCPALLKRYASRPDVFIVFAGKAFVHFNWVTKRDSEQPVYKTRIDRLGASISAIHETVCNKGALAGIIDLDEFNSRQSTVEILFKNDAKEIDAYKTLLVDLQKVLIEIHPKFGNERYHASNRQPLLAEILKKSSVPSPVAASVAPKQAVVKLVEPYYTAEQIAVLIGLGATRDEIELLDGTFFEFLNDMSVANFAKLRRYIRNYQKAPKKSRGYEYGKFIEWKKEQYPGEEGKMFERCEICSDRCGGYRFHCVGLCPN